MLEILGIHTRLHYVYSLKINEIILFQTKIVGFFHRPQYWQRPIHQLMVCASGFGEHNSIVLVFALRVL